MSLSLIFTLAQVNEAATFVLNNAKNSKIVAFYGEMGAGKTTLIKAICNRLQVTDEVTSPTFALIYEYNTKSIKNVYHFDFYRINNLNEALNLGCDDYFSSGCFCLIEWPQKIENLLPADTLKIEIRELENGKRKIIIL